MNAIDRYEQAKGLVENLRKGGLKFQSGVTGTIKVTRVGGDCGPVPKEVTDAIANYLNGVDLSSAAEEAIQRAAKEALELAKEIQRAAEK